MKQINDIVKYMKENNINLDDVVNKFNEIDNYQYLIDKIKSIENNEEDLEKLKKFIDGGMIENNVVNRNHCYNKTNFYKMLYNLNTITDATPIDILILTHIRSYEDDKYKSYNQKIMDDLNISQQVLMRSMIKFKEWNILKTDKVEGKNCKLHSFTNFSEWNIKNKVLLLKDTFFKYPSLDKIKHIFNAELEYELSTDDLVNIICFMKRKKYNLITNTTSDTKLVNLINKLKNQPNKNEETLKQMYLDL